MADRLRHRADRLKSQTYALYIVAGDPRTPLAAKVIAGAVVAYAVSPIDLIPDFIPVLGYLDDLVVLPFGVWLAFRLVPHDLLAEARAHADSVVDGDLPTPRGAMAAIVILWLLGAIVLLAVVYRLLVRPEA